MTRITITHRLPTGTTFAVTADGPPEAVFVSGRVADVAGAEIGLTYDADLAANPRDNERTPWQALSMKTLGGPTPRGRVMEVLELGGVWTPAEMAAQILGENEASVRGTLLGIFKDGGCAKFELRTSPVSALPAKEWFTCTPDEADVSEWENEGC